MEYLLLIITTVFINNVVFAQFLGICPVLGISNKSSTALGMGSAVIFVMTLATIVTYLFQYAILKPLHIEYMQTIVYIFVIASLVQVVEIILKKTIRSLYQTLGIYLPLITTNCAILGVALLVIQNNYTLLQSIVFAVGTSTGFTLAMVIIASIREQLELADVPEGMKGIPIALITIGILSLAFMGFSGISQ